MVEVADITETEHSTAFCLGWNFGMELVRNGLLYVESAASHYDIDDAYASLNTDESDPKSDTLLSAYEAGMIKAING